MIPDISYKNKVENFYNDSSTDEEMEAVRMAPNGSLRAAGNDSSDEDECKLDESILKTLNRKLCTYEQSDSSGGEEEREETEEENMRRIDACINRHTLEVDDGGGSSSEDEFEKEMEGELDEKVGQLEEGMGATHEEEFYDPREDEKDQAWEDETRRRYLHKPAANNATDAEKASSLNKRKDSKSSEGSKSVTFKDEPKNSKDNSSRTRTKHKLPSSDAVLNCPCCMQLLCLDCQRHDLYLNQYRAMFVMNCKVVHAEVVKIPEKSRKRKRWSRKGEGEKMDVGGEGVGEGSVVGEGTAEGVVEELGRDDFKGVECEGCGTRVAVVDVDEVFHFFNVLASY